MECVSSVLNKQEQPWTALNMLCENVMPKVGLIRKSLIIKMERAKGFEPSTLTLAT